MKAMQFPGYIPTFNKKYADIPLLKSKENERFNLWQVKPLYLSLCRK